MKIKSCEIGSFGRLEGKTIVLSDGITVIRGKNESGKSTLSAFIKYILYGYMGRGRDEKGNEKLKYTPWNGSQSSGALVLEASDGSVFRAERRGDGKSGDAHILDSVGSRCFAGAEIGEALYGTDAVTFSKSAFVGQSDIEGSGMRDIGAGLERLIMDSDNSEDFDTAIKTLTIERNNLYNKMRSTGLVFELTAQLDELKAKRLRESDANTRLVCIRHLACDSERKINANKSRLEELYLEAENIAAYEALEMLTKINSAEMRAEESRTKYEAAITESERNGMLPDKQYVEDLETAYDEYMTLESGTLRAESELGRAGAKHQKCLDKLGDKKDTVSYDEKEIHSLYEKASELFGKSRKMKTLAIILLCLIVTIPISPIFFVLSSKAKKMLTSLLSENGFTSYESLCEFNARVDDVYSSIRDSEREYDECKSRLDRIRKSFDHARGRLKHLLSLIGEDTEEQDFTLEGIRKSILPSLKSAIIRIDNAYAEYSTDSAALEALLSVTSIDELHSKAEKRLEAPSGRKKEEVDVEIRFHEGANALLAKKLSELRTEIASLEAVNTDPAVTDAEIEDVFARLSEARLRLDAIELAIELCDESRASIREGILPRISESAAELFSAFTDGKYRSLFFDKDFGLKFLAADDTETRNVASLSAGAADAAYLALRIALARVLFKEKPTFIFDESFAKCDDARLANILDALLVLSRDYQIVILTCHEREEKYLSGKCKTVILDSEI